MPGGSPEPDDVRDRYAIVKIEIPIPQNLWYAAFTRRHPEVVVEINNLVSLDGTLVLAELEIFGTEEDLTREISLYDDVERVERIHGLTEVSTYRVVFQNPVPVELANNLRIVLRYPRVVREAVFSCETIAQVSKVHEYVEQLRAAGLTCRILSMRHDTLRSARPILTPTQRDLFRRAYALGYFEVPRRITLSALAREVGRSPSSVSETIAIVERKLAALGAAAIE